MKLFILWVGLIGGNFLWAFLRNRNPEGFSSAAERSYFQGLALLTAGFLGL
jgi:hypothetical protein